MLSVQLKINTNILTPHLHNHLCTLRRPSSLSPDRISPDLVPTATAPSHQVLDNDWELGLGSPCRGSKPAACGRRRPPTQRPLGDRTQPPRLPPGPAVTHRTEVSTRFTHRDLPSSCSTLNHLNSSYYSARVIEPVPLHPGQHPGSWTELWTQGLTGQHAGNWLQRMTQNAPGQRQEGSSRLCPTDASE